MTFPENVVQTANQNNKWIHLIDFFSQGIYLTRTQLPHAQEKEKLNCILFLYSKKVSVHHSTFKEALSP